MVLKVSWKIWIKHIKVESGFNYGLHETFGGFSRPFHSTSNTAEKKVTQGKL